MEGTADYCTFGTDLADVLHVEVDDGGSQAGREEVMDLLGEIFGVGQNHKEALFFIAEPLEGVEEETDSLSNSFGGGEPLFATERHCFVRRCGLTCLELIVVCLLWGFILQ